MDMFAKFFDIFGTFIAQFIAQFTTPTLFANFFLKSSLLLKHFLRTFWVSSKHYCTIYCKNIFCELFSKKFFFPSEKT